MQINDQTKGGNYKFWEENQILNELQNLIRAGGLTPQATKSLTGTASSSTTTITGVGTLFLSELRVGDLIYQTSNPDIARRIVSITSNLVLTIESAFPSEFSGVACSIYNTTQLQISIPLIIGLEKVDEIVISNDAFVEFIDLDDGYNHKFVFENLTPITDNVQLLSQISRDGGSTYVNTNYTNRFSFGISNTTTRAEYQEASVSTISLSSNDTFQTNSGIGNATGESYSGKLEIINPSDTSNTKKFAYESIYINAGSNLIETKGGSYLTGSQLDYDAIKFYASSGNLNTGKIIHYRYK